MDWGRHTIEACRTSLRNLHQRAGKAVQQLSPEELNWRPNEESNSIANLVLHLEGNFRERFGSWLAGIPYSRDRTAEFDSREPLSQGEILEKLDAIFSLADRVCAELTPDRLNETFRHHDQELTLLQLLILLTTHAAEHVGQILYIAKLQKGPAYQILSRPHR